MNNLNLLTIRNFVCMNRAKMFCSITGSLVSENPNRIFILRWILIIDVPEICFNDINVILNVSKALLLSLGLCLLLIYT